MEEIWKPIIIEKKGILYDYTGLYEVSNLGRVRSLGNDRTRKEKILKCKPCKDGYVRVELSKNGKREKFSVHRLVATAFIPNPENLPVINHRDENPSNCNVDNLEWCTQQHNVQYSAYKRTGDKNPMYGRTGDKNPMYGRTGDKNPMSKKVICLDNKRVFNCTREAEDWCCKKGISSCCKGKQKTCAGYHWQYLEDYKRQLRMESDIKNSQLVA